MTSIDTSAFSSRIVNGLWRAKIAQNEQRSCRPLSTLNPNQPCQVDDDHVVRGTAHMDWWETPYGFTF